MLTSTQCYKGVNIIRLLAFLVIRCQFNFVWAIQAVVIRVTDIRFLEKDHSLSLQ